MARVVDLRSDTLTLPTEQMYEALREAPLGDDVFHEDPTVNRLEAMAAERLGKEAAVLVSSGTQGNLVSLLAHCQRGNEVILGANSHIYNYEAGGLSALGGMLPRVLPDTDGCLDPAQVAAAVRPRDVHAGMTALVCLENTHNRAGGAVIPPEKMRAVAEVAHARDIPVHLDGARVFNAAAALGVDVREITQHVDSVTFCLSKGLSAPVGSVLCGSQAFIEKARAQRKLLGSGMRQAGWIAAAGIVALETTVGRLAEDHANAHYLAERLARIPGIGIDPARVQSNLVFFDVTAPDLTAQELVARLKKGGVRCNATGPRRIRMVTHRNVNREDVERAADIVEQAARGQFAGAAPVAAGAYSG